MGMTVWPEVERAAETKERARAQAGEGGTTPFGNWSILGFLG